MNPRSAPMAHLRQVGLSAYQVGRWRVEPLQPGIWRASCAPVSILFPTLDAAVLALTGQRLIPIWRQQRPRSPAYQARIDSLHRRNTQQ